MTNTSFTFSILSALIFVAKGVYMTEKASALVMASSIMAWEEANDPLSSSNGIRLSENVKNIIAFMDDLKIYILYSKDNIFWS